MSTNLISVLSKLNGILASHSERASKVITTETPTVSGMRLGKALNLICNA